MINSYTSLSPRHPPSFKSFKSTLRSSKSSLDIHSITKDNGLRSMRVLLNNLGNVRYLGLSEFHSEHSFQNSSPIWSFTKDPRFKNNSSAMFNGNYYDLKPLQSNISTSFSKAKRVTLKHNLLERSPSPQEYTFRGLAEDNIAKGKGTSFIGKFATIKTTQYTNIRSPGPGQYNLVKNNLSFQNPITIKSRNGFYYEDDLKKKNHIVSMQKYSPKMSLIESGRFKGITFGFGNKVSIDNNNNNSNNKYIRFVPGPGTYNLPGIFDKGIKSKPALN